MKKGIKKRLIFILIILAVIIILISGYFQITGNVGFDSASNSGHTYGPSQEEQTCMMTCMKCTSPGVGCTGNSSQCTAQCNVQKPEQTAEESCVETCTKKGCGEYDFTCQQKNQAVCDKECGMIKEPEAKSEEEQCIRDCVNKEQEGLICSGGEGGEKGNEICQRCAKSCEHLYAGPCLDELKLDAAKKACQTCEHCYGKPVMGDSGEGYECIVSIDCADASGEFGDNPGTGEGIAKVVSSVGDAIGNVVESIGNFFQNLFGGSAGE